MEIVRKDSRCVNVCNLRHWEKKIKVDCESVGSSRCCATSRGIIDVVLEANSVWTLFSTLCSLSLSLSFGPYANFDAAARCQTISRAERGFHHLWKWTSSCPKLDRIRISLLLAAEAVISLVNLISSTSSASLRMRVRYEETRLRRSCGPWAFSNPSPYFPLITTISWRPVIASH